MMKKLTIEDLVQFDRDRMARLTKDALLDLSVRLRDFGIELYEKLNEDSSNSSKPPSGDGPFKRGKRPKSEEAPEENSGESGEEAVEPESDECAVEDGTNIDEQEKRKPGKQIGAEGFGRVEKGPPERTEDHWPETCSLCSRDLAKPPYLSAYTGHNTYELEKDVDPNQIRIVRTPHRYHTVVCRCGHENKAAPGQGAVSVVEGRKRDLKLAENRLVGPMLATFIAALNRDYKMSRKKIRQYLADWFGFEVSLGTICNCIREAGVACYPIVESIIEELQEEENDSQNRLTIYRLPSYSPDFNPIGKLWKNTKRDATHCKFFPTFEDLRPSVLEAFEKYSKNAAKVVCVMNKLRRSAGIAY